MNQFSHGGICIKTPDSWLDVTSTLDAAHSPFTLARADGYGALQFSLAIYQKGRKPDIKAIDLRELILDFSESRELGAGFDNTEKNENLLIHARSFHAGANFIRVWYCSDSMNVALITYVCNLGLHLDEIVECEDIVNNIRFEQ